MVDEALGGEDEAVEVENQHEFAGHVVLAQFASGDGHGAHFSREGICRANFPGVEFVEDVVAFVEGLGGRFLVHGRDLKLIQRSRKFFSTPGVPNM